MATAFKKKNPFLQVTVAAVVETCFNQSGEGGYPCNKSVS